MHMQMPFALMSTAYRRKKLMAGIMCGDKRALNNVVATFATPEAGEASNSGAEDPVAGEEGRVVLACLPACLRACLPACVLACLVGRWLWGPCGIAILCQ